jgi:hypothetical protein
MEKRNAGLDEEKRNEKVIIREKKEIIADTK